MALACPTRSRRRHGFRRSLRAEPLEARRLLAVGDSFLDSQLSLGPIPLAQSYEERLSSAEAVDRWWFSVSTCGRLTIWADVTATSELDPNLLLWSASGERLLVASDDDRGAAGDDAASRDARIQMHLAPGVYQVDATASPFAPADRATGDYLLRVVWEPTGPHPTKGCSDAEVGSCPYRADGEPWSITHADFDRDGYLDLATANSMSDDVSIWRGLGDGSFAKQSPSIRVGTLPVSIVAVQLNDDNGDGVVDGSDDWDLGVTNAGKIDTNSSDISLLFGRGDGTFDAEQRIGPDLCMASGPRQGKSAIGSEPSAMAVADLDGVGDPDLLVVNAASDDISVLLRDRQGAIYEVQRHKVDQARHVTTDDIDGDKRLDVVVTSRKRNRVVVLLNHPGQHGSALELDEVAVPWGQRDPFAVGDGPFVVVVDDFDHDGRTDMATTNDRGGTVSVLLGAEDRAEWFQPYTNYAVGPDAEFMLKGDFNGDTYVDLLTGNEDSRDLTLLLNQRDGTFHAGLPLPVYCLPDELTAGDFNGDGRLDVAVVSRDNQVVILLGLGDGQFVRSDETRVGNRPEVLLWKDVHGTPLDLNGDQLRDLVTANSQSDSVSVLLGRGDGSFQPEYRLPVGNVPHTMLAVDVNQDGRTDLVTVNEGSDDLSLLLGYGDGRFAVGAIEFEPEAEGERGAMLGDSPWSIVSGDFDANGHLDFAVANRVSNNVTVLYGTHDLRFRPADFRVGEFPEWIATTDRNGDGLLDLVTANRLSHDVSILIGHTSPSGAHTFLAEQREVDLPPPFDFTAQSVVPGWNRSDHANHELALESDYFFPRGFVTGDFDEDGQLDLAVTNDVANEFSIFLGHGDGTFQPEMRFGTLADPEFMTAGDFNQDGHLDLLLVHDHEDSYSVWLGTGSGSFRQLDPVEIEDGKGPEYAALADFNGDTKLDVAIGVDTKAGGQSEIVVLLSGGDGTFVESVRVPVSLQAQSLLSRDFNGDAVADLVVVSDQSGSVSIVLGVGDGTFGTAIEYRLPESASGSAPFPRSLDVADLDGDTNLDVVVSDLAHHTAWVLWGKKKEDRQKPEDLLQEALAPIFSRPDQIISTTFDTASTPIAVADLDQDGHLDVVKVNELSGRVSVLLGHGPDRKFDDELQFVVGGRPGALAIADINGDDRLDLLVGNRGSHEISILLGTPPDGSGGTLFHQPHPPVKGGQQPWPQIGVQDKVDWNNDGIEDQVALNSNTSELQVQLALKSGPVDSRQVAAEIRTSPQLANLDPDHDPTAELIQVSAQGRLQVRVLLEPPVSPWFESSFETDTDGIRDVAVVQTDAGRPLLAALRQGATGGAIQLYQWRDHQLQPFGEASLPCGVFCTRIVAGNLNGDGVDDLVVIDAANSTANVFYSTDATAGTFSAPVSIPLHGSIPADIVLLDMDGADGTPDGRVDYLVVTSEGSGDLSVLSNEPADQFPLSQRLRVADGLYGTIARDGPPQTSSQARSAGTTSGDFNQDGLPDLAVANHGLNQVAVLLAKAAGGFADPMTLATDSGPRDVVAADVNHDDRLDLVVLNEKAATLSVFLGDGQGGFPSLPLPAASAGHLPSGLAVHDVDHDKVVDLVISNPQGDDLVLIGDGTGAFRSPSFVPEPNVALAAADVDGDGDDDLIMTNERGDRVWVESGEFDEHKELSAPGAVEVEDLDGDGILDILVANRGDNNLSVYRGQGRGTFGDAEEFPTGTNPSSLAIHDVNGDQVLDVAVTNQGSDDVSILLGDRSSDNRQWTLRSGVRLKAGRSPVDVVIGQYTDDTLPDLLVASRDENLVYLLAGLGQGFFDDEHPVRFQVGDAPREILVGQFDGQPGWDLATINSGSAGSGSSVTLTANIGAMARSAAASRDYFVEYGTRSATGGSRVRDGLVISSAASRVDELVLAHEDGRISLFSFDSAGFGRTGEIAPRAEMNAYTFSAIVMLKPPASAPNMPRFALAGFHDENVKTFIVQFPDGVPGASVRASFDALNRDERVRQSSSTQPNNDAGDESEALWLSSQDGAAGSMWDEPSAAGDPTPVQPSDVIWPVLEAIYQAVIDQLVDAREQVDEVAYRATESLLVQLDLALPPDAIYELLVVVAYDVQLAQQRLREGEAPAEPQGASENMTRQEPRPPNTVPRITQGQLALWRREYDDAIRDWCRDNPNLVAIVMDRFISPSPIPQLPPELASVPSPPPAAPTDPVVVAALPPAPVVLPPELDHVQLARLDSDHELSTVLETVALVSLAVAAYRLHRRPRNRRPAVVEHPVDPFWDELDPPGRHAVAYRSDILGYPCRFSEGDAMDRQVKDLLPDSWWEVARCVDEYEAALDSGFPDLRQLTAAVSPAHRPAACLELAAVDMEHRFKAGQPVTVEHYLDELQEIASDSGSVDGLIAEEYQLRRQRGEQPAVSEYRQRFPDRNIDDILNSDPDLTLPGDSGTKPTPKIAPAAVPTMIGRYEVCEEIGAGTFGRVYRCRDAKLKREVAIKVPHTDKSLSHEQVQGYLHEARGAARLHHPGIVSVLDTGELADGRGYVVYEYVAGQTLRQRIQDDDYSREDAVRWCIEIAEALHYAHTHNVVHRDVTPANVLLDVDGHVRLTDFGLARVDDQFYRDDSGRVVGTVAYMSPEQARGDSQWASPQADIHALGVILYELLTKRRPFNPGSGDMAAMLEQIERRVPSPPRTIDETIPPALEEVCIKAMAKNPTDRYSTAADLAAALRAAIAVPTPTVTATWLPWIAWPLVVAAAAVLIAVAVWRDDGGVNTSTLVPITRQVDEPDVGVQLWVDYMSYDLTSQESPEVLPIVDGDAFRLRADLRQPGYLYVFLCYGHRPADLVYPASDDLNPPPQVIQFSYPPGDDNWHPFEAERQYGAEMFLFAVADEPLSAETLARFQRLSFQPSTGIQRALAANRSVIQIPTPADEVVRSIGGQTFSTAELAFDQTFADALNQLQLRSWRAVVFSHAPSDEESASPQEP